MIKRIDQHGHPERIGQQDKLLPFVVALFARGGQKLNARKPFGLREFNLLHKGVHMLDEAGDDMPHAWVLSLARIFFDHRFGDVVCCIVTHTFPSF